MPGTYKENISFKGKNIILRSTDPTSPTVVASTIIDGNKAGSVVIFFGSELTTCVLSGFTITNGYAINGGGIYGAFCGNCDFSRATIQNNIITGNQATDCGGGICGCDGIIQNNIIWHNIANNSGGGLNDCYCIIRNCIIWANEASEGGAQLYDSATPIYSCIQDWSEEGTGNISADPQLLNPEAGDFYLTPDSPCIDAGCYIEISTRDFEDNLRGYDGSNEPRGDGSNYDIGADEYIGILPTPAPTPLYRILHMNRAKDFNEKVNSFIEEQEAKQAERGG